ncbi:DnaJ domain-containing protein [Mucilaginibacter sp.]|jgi:curved DNA-binding protein CbpA|uniref:DnaJ domain-containing protein n=1 Tax=Mucilaginibacter sp. TaxID=1882438 RepID=UPI002BD13F90|nr:DnaJ domain-containing protein [Mucilaginibacter sp.]HTI58908.1 DnaJ domain-containing protein [Mucilaginibacter sp.]
MKDFYYILGTPRDAGQPEIEAAYQKLARKFYRDGEGQDEFMDAHFREIAEAYDILRDAVRRRKYDAAFKRNQQHGLAAFKLKYLNIALTLTFLAVTALFASYVISALRGRPAKRPPVKAVMQQSAASKTAIVPKRHRKALMQPVKNRLAAPGMATDDQAAPIKPIPPAVQAVTPVPDTMASDQTPEPGFPTLHANITGIVYLHQSADYNSPVIAKIPGETRVQLMQKGKLYCKIAFNGQIGYVLSSSINGRP